MNETKNYITRWKMKTQRKRKRKNALVATRCNFFPRREKSFVLEEKMREQVAIPLIKIYSTTGNTYELDVTT